ncbi:hypothetical protein [Parendozoicomonas haliclonae]|uniref:Uncharacterized protein n=2 Tax=Parendozoicomonas haliclonae TaxID=1960125 RepID=A0A1X7AE73_9GAMM|nr:hypothetical protein [Parendozoicomonas haliclonae]SMA33250.1 hypothetical protein EHSB41UT_00247 [Parendozoicomonas haliclonae]
MVDGTEVTRDYKAEFNNAIFRADISSMEGTFAGKLTTSALHVVKNLTIGGRAVARHWLAHIPKRWYGDGFSGGGDNIYHNLIRLNCNVPSGESGVLLVTCQYNLDNADDDDSGTNFVCWHEMNIAGETIFNTGAQPWGTYYITEKRMLHMGAKSVGAGSHVVDVNWRWNDASTTVYPVFTDITLKVDFIKK